MTLNLRSAAETAASFRDARRRGRRKALISARARRLRQMVLKHVDRRSPRTTGEVYNRMLNDYGSCGYRAVADALKALVKAGDVSRGPDGHLKLI